jgi:anti-sigma-K factor RskA
MSHVQHDKDEQYFQGLMGAAAFGHLNDKEQAEFEAYLETNESARIEFGEMLSAVDLLPLALEEAEPSAGLRDRIAQAVGADTGSESITEDMPRPIREVESHKPTNISWLSSRTGKALAAAAAVVLIAVAAIAIAMNLQGTDPENIDLAAIPEGVTGSLEYRPDDDKFVFEVENMPEAPENSVYQVWLIPPEGNPESVGLMEGSEFEVEADRHAYAAFAITVEPAPAGSTGPTSDPVVVAPLTS